MNVLLVDDSPLLRELMARFLINRFNPTIIQAENGVEALSLLRDHSADLIISDWNMPEMSGIEFLERVRESTQWAALPFLMATTESAPSFQQRAKEAGATGYLVKPFTEQQFVTAIEAALENAP